MQQSEIEAAMGKYREKIEKDYERNKQLARYTDLTDIEKSGFLQYGGLNSQDCHVFILDGNKSQGFDNDPDRCEVQFQDKRSYIMLYLVSEYSEFSRFRAMLKLLPMKYYLKLKQMYIYHASLYMRTVLWFKNSKRQKLWLRNTKFIGELQPLFDQLIFPSAMVDLLPLKNLKILQDEQPINKVFSIPLEKVQTNQFDIPIILDQLISFLISKPERIQQQDIFRKCGSITEETQLIELLDQGNYDCLQVIDDVNIVCSVLKKFFSKLPDPLINNKLCKLVFDELQSQVEEIKLCHTIIKQMEKPNRTLLLLMISFLIQVSQYSEKNHMTLFNLGRVFAPCFMRPVPQDPISYVLEIEMTVKFTQILLNNFEKMFPDYSFKLFLQAKPPVNSSTASSESSNSQDKQQFDQNEEQQI
ncbi:phosphatidylinositol-3 [Paramecium bursaria]